jgi:hypothetical protein
MKHWPFEVVSDGGKPKIQVAVKGENKTFFPEEVSIFYYYYFFFLLIKLGVNLLLCYLIGIYKN